MSLCIYTFIILVIEPFMEDDEECSKLGDVNGRTYANPDYVNSACLWMRRDKLCFLSRMECDLTRRLLMSVLLGAAIGWERRDSDR